MDENVGIKISSANTSVNSASGPDLLMSTKYPFEKLDVTKSVSFQTINLTFLNNPPDPSVGNQTNTLFYSFAHGYSYIPKIWTLIYDVTADAYAQGGYYYTNVDISNYAFIYVTVDTTNVNFYVLKNNGDGHPPNLAGRQFQFRCYVFVDNMV